MIAKLSPVSLFLIAVPLASACCKDKSRSEPTAAQVVPGDGTTVDAGPPVPAGSLLADRFLFELAVYHLPKPKAEPLAAVAKLIRGKPLALKKAEDERPSETPTVFVRFPSMSTYAPPDLDSLAYFARGLDDETKNALQRSESVTVLRFEGPGSQAVQTVSSANELVKELTGVTGGVIWDEETREVFSPEAYTPRIENSDSGAPDITKQITIHAYRNGDLLRLVTLGMAKFALPDVAVEDVSASAGNSMSSLINLACQHFVERHELEQPGTLTVSIKSLRNGQLKDSLTKSLRTGATGSVVLRLATAVPQQGDAENRLVNLAFPGSVSGLQQRHASQLAELFGADDSIVGVKHDEELDEASRRAKAKVMKLKPRFAQGPPPEEVLKVKAPFTTDDGGTEWMWVEVVRWQGSTIQGILDNEPYHVSGLHSGARVEVRQDSLFDYIFVKPDGGVEGNETAPLLERKGPAQK